jgi:hypothetical protein
MTWTQAVTLAIAVLGAVLGIINTWQSIDQNRVKLRVSVRLGYFFVGTHRTADPQPQVAIEIMNRSPFALTIAQVGFQMRGSDNLLALIDPILPDGGKMPRRMEPRSAFTAYFSPEASQNLPSQSVSRAYANTDSGEVAYSSRTALRKLLRSLADRS